jgi:hypothetical protein
MYPEVLFFNFMESLNAAATGVPATVLQTAAVHVISKLAEMNQVDAKLWAAFKGPYKSMFSSGISLQADFVVAVETIARHHSESWHDAVGLGPVETAAHAVLRMKKEFDPQVQSGNRTIDIMALMVSGAGLLNIALVTLYDEYARIACMGQRPDLDTGLMMWKQTSEDFGHWEAATEVNFAALEFVSASHQRVLRNFSAMWQDKLKGGKVVSASPPKDSQFAMSPAAAKVVAEKEATAATAVANAAKAQQAADKAVADAAAAKDTDGFEIVGSKKRAAKQKQDDADKQAAAKHAASDENKEAALDRDATKESVRQDINERFKRSPAVAQRIRNLVAHAYSVGSIPSIVRHALRTGSCVFGTACPRKGCDKAQHKKVPAAVVPPRTVPPAPPASSSQHSGDVPARVIVHVGDGSGRIPTYAELAAAAPPDRTRQAAENENEHLRQMLFQERQLQQRVLTTSPPQVRSGGLQLQSDQAIALMVQNAMMHALPGVLANVMQAMQQK